MSTKLHTKFYNNNRLLLTVNPGEDIAENDPVRVVDAIVEGLDLKDFKKPSSATSIISGWRHRSVPTS